MRTLALLTSLYVSTSSLLASPIAIRGQVLSQAATPMEGARVELHPSPSSRYQQQVRHLLEPPVPIDVGRAAADGFFAIAAPEAGLYEVHIRLPGYLTMVWQLRPLLEPAELPPVHLRKTIELQATVRDPRGRPFSFFRRPRQVP